jgi:hypothetical protein
VVNLDHRSYVDNNMITIRRGPVSVVAVLIGLATLTSTATASPPSNSKPATVIARIPLTGHPLSAPLADPSRHIAYVPHGRYRPMLEVDTAAKTAKRVPGIPKNGSVLNHTTGYLYQFGEYEHDDPHQRSGVRIIAGSHTVKRLRLGVGAAINLGHGVTGLLTEPSVEAADSRYRLLRYRGATQLSNTQICAGLSTDPFWRSQYEMMYDATSGLFYVACHEWLPRKNPEVQVFRGPRLVKTIRNVPGDFFERDEKRDLVYLVSGFHVHVFRGTHRLGSVKVPSSRRDPAPETSGIDPTSGDLYLGSGKPDGHMSVVRGTHLIANSPTPTRVVVVDQRTPAWPTTSTNKGPATRSPASVTARCCRRSPRTPSCSDTTRLARTSSPAARTDSSS